MVDFANSHLLPKIVPCVNSVTWRSVVVCHLYSTSIDCPQELGLKVFARNDRKKKKNHPFFLSCASEHKTNGMTWDDRKLTVRTGSSNKGRRRRAELRICSYVGNACHGRLRLSSPSLSKCSQTADALLREDRALRKVLGYAPKIYIIVQLS